MTKKTGRGLASLIPTVPMDSGPPEQSLGPTSGDQSAAGLTTAEGLSLTFLRPGEITTNPMQPRTEFDPDALTELSGSLRDIGFLQPVVVRLTTSGNYELVAGERRLRASQLAGFTEIPALVRQTDDTAMLRDALLENLQRVPLNPIEEAAAYEQLLTEFGGTHEELSHRLHRSRSQVSNTLRLLKLPPAVQRRVAAGVLSAGHARALLSLSDQEEMELLAKRVVAEGISVRALEELIATSKPAKRRRSSVGSAKSLPELDAVADRLSEELDTRVRVTMGRSKGKIVVEFAGVDDLHRVLSKLHPTVISDG